MSDIKQIAVVGCGAWGANLVRNFHALGVLGWLCDANAAKLQTLQEKYAGLAVTTDYTEILANPAVAGVVLATNAEFHAPMALAALRAGKDVFVEKPLALRYQDGAEMVRVANVRQDAQRVKIPHQVFPPMPATNYRYFCHNLYQWQ